MRPRDLILAVAVAAAWGVNFVIIDIGLDHFPPVLFSALRFLVAALPAVLFIGRPPAAWRWVIAVALALGVTKFGLLFAGMAAGMPPGLSSLVLQSQVIFTMLFAVLLLRERPGRRQLAGLALAAAGVAVVAVRAGDDLPLGAFALVLGAAVAWGVANVATRVAAPTDTLRFMVWVSAVAAGPLLVISLLVEGPSRDLAALRAVDPAGIAALLYVALVATLAGFGAWGFLIRRYGATAVAPFSMLVPVFGLASAALLLDERVTPADLTGAALVIGGVLLGAVRRRSRTPAPGAEPPRGAEPSGSVEPPRGVEPSGGVEPAPGAEPAPLAEPAPVLPFGPGPGTAVPGARAGSGAG